MPNFKLSENQLITRLDKWLYFIKYLEDFQSIPAIIADEIFSQAFEKAELAKFGKSDLANYESSLKVFRDNKAVYDYAIDIAFDEGKQEGFTEGKLEMARFMKSENENLDRIIKYTGLSKDEIERL